MLLFSTKAYDAQADVLCGLGGYQRGAVHESRFPDGERYIRLENEVSGEDVVIMGGTFDEASTVELFDLGCTAVHYGARRLTLVIPYFGCSTMERAVMPGEAVTAKHRARLLSAIPAAAYGNRVFLVDLHSEGIPHYFDSNVRAVHVYAKDEVSKAARRLGGDDFVLACTDSGRAKWVESLANDLGVDASFVFKRRLDGERTEVSAVSAQVEDRTVVIYDDMIRTGGSLINAAKAYKDAGAAQLSVVTTHGVFPGDAVGRLMRAGLFDRVICTDSHPRAVVSAAKYPDFLEVVGLAGVLNDALHHQP